MFSFISHSIRHKFALVILAATMAALLVTGIAMVLYDLHSYERTGVADLTTQSEILGLASAPALEFEDSKSANEYLQLLRARPDISEAAIYGPGGNLFASYTRRNLDLQLPERPQAEGVRVEGRDIVLFKRIERNKELLGTVYIKADFGVRKRLTDFLGIFGIVTVISLMAALLLSLWLRGVLIKPILATSAIARRLIETRDYTLRVRKTTSDEVGDLVDSFNNMVAEVGRRTADLEASNRTLEHEIVERQRAEGERAHAQQRILQQLEHMHLLDQITRSTGERLDLRSIFQTVVRSVEDSLPVDFACVGLYDAGAATVKITCVGFKSLTLALDLAITEGGIVKVDSNGLSRCLQGHLVYEPDVSQVPFPFPTRLAAGGLRSLVLAPLRSESQIFGLLLVARKLSAGFSSAECEFLRQLSEHVALAANQAQLYGALQQAYDDLRQTQQVAMQEERLRALGQMASGIAHDINNALSPVSLYTDSLLETETNLSARARGYLETIQRAVGDVANTLARMREFYRQREVQLDLEPVDLNELVTQVLDLTRARWRDMPLQHGISIEPVTDLAVDLPRVMGVGSEIREAMINLVFNAVDAMPKGGKVTLRTRRTAMDTGKPGIALEVIDQGIGMDEDTRRRCLEPFFTTKGERGTGLGLAMVFGTVQRHGADMQIDSALGEGSTMRLIFAVPEANGMARGGAAITATQAVPARLRLLLVDDDPVLLNSLFNALEADGHVLETASGGAAGIEAVRSAQQRGEHFSAIITDLGMPAVDGRKVAAAVKAISPTTPVIMLTGWGQRMIADGDIPPHVDRVLSKPPKLRELREALGQVCRTPPATTAG